MKFNKIHHICYGRLVAKSIGSTPYTYLIKGNLGDPYKVDPYSDVLARIEYDRGNPTKDYSIRIISDQIIFNMEDLVEILKIIKTGWSI